MAPKTHCMHKYNTTCWLLVLLWSDSACSPIATSESEATCLQISYYFCWVVGRQRDYWCQNGSLQFSLCACVHFDLSLPEHNLTCSDLMYLHIYAAQFYNVSRWDTVLSSFFILLPFRQTTFSLFFPYFIHFSFIFQVLCWESTSDSRLLAVQWAFWLSNNVTKNSARLHTEQRITFTFKCLVGRYLLAES